MGICNSSRLLQRRVLPAWPRQQRASSVPTAPRAPGLLQRFKPARPPPPTCDPPSAVAGALAAPEALAAALAMAQPASWRHAAIEHAGCMPPCFCSGLAASCSLTQQHPSSTPSQPQRPRACAPPAASLLPLLLCLILCAASNLSLAAAPSPFRWQSPPAPPLTQVAPAQTRASAVACLPCPCVSSRLSLRLQPLFDSKQKPAVFKCEQTRKERECGGP